MTGAPQRAGAAARTGDGLSFPVDRELRHVKPLRGVRLPATIRAHRANELNPVVDRAVDEEGGIHVPAIEEVLSRQECLAR